MSQTIIEPGDIALVTGATGFVGSAVLRTLADRGLKPRALSRQSSPRTNLDGVDCEIAVGDMTDPAAMTAAMGGVRYLFHVAADYRLWARDPNAILRGQPGRNPDGYGGGRGRRSRENRLHLVRRHPARRPRSGR